MRRLLPALALLLAASAADAQVRQGLVELGGAGFLTLREDPLLVLQPTVGYFVSDRVEVGLNPSIATDFDDASALVTAFGALHFPSSPGARTVPFVGAEVGADLNGDGDVVLGAQGGVKQFFLPGGALTVAVAANASGGLDNVAARVQAGVSIFIGR